MDGECVLPGAYYVCAALRRGATLQNAGFHRYLSLHERFVGNPNGGTQVGVTPREGCFVSKISKIFHPIGICNFIYYRVFVLSCVHRDFLNSIVTTP